MRLVHAMKLGGMATLEQNIYNRRVSTDGFESAAREVQELYLAGKRTEAMFALPDELIDLVSIVGPRDKAKEKIRAFKEAGVDTLIVWPIMPDQAERQQEMRLIAELAEEVG